MSRYRLQRMALSDVFLIAWADRRPGYVPGDCYVRAIEEKTDPVSHPRLVHTRARYTEPMTLDEARAIVAANPLELGSMIHDCVGLLLEDGRAVDFAEPVIVRNQ